MKRVESEISRIECDHELNIEEFKSNHYQRYFLYTKIEEANGFLVFLEDDVNLTCDASRSLLCGISHDPSCSVYKSVCDAQTLDVRNKSNVIVLSSKIII